MVLSITAMTSGYERAKLTWHRMQIIKMLTMPMGWSFRILIVVTHILSMDDYRTMEGEVDILERYCVNPRRGGNFLVILINNTIERYATISPSLKIYNSVTLFHYLRRSRRQRQSRWLNILLMPRHIPNVQLFVIQQWISQKAAISGITVLEVRNWFELMRYQLYWVRYCIYKFKHNYISSLLNNRTPLLKKQ